MVTTSIDGLRELIGRYGIGREAAEGLQSFLRLLEKWNPRINLTASTKWEALGPLFEEAIWAAQFHPGGSTSHLDIGSGAGFPAIPIVLLNPGVKLELVESRNRKCIFLETVARELGLANLQVHGERLEAFLNRIEARVAWHCISWKAIKVTRKDAAALLKQAPRAQFWLFHGITLPLEDPSAWERATRLCRREVFAGVKSWFLSIYVSRDTETPFHVKHRARARAFRTPS